MKSLKTHVINSTKKFEAALKKRQKEGYVLKLYVTGATPQSVTAILNIKNICENYLKGHYTLEVIDLYQKPGLAAGEQIVAAPTLIKQLPLPVRKIVGDLSGIERVLVGLGLYKKKWDQKD